MLMSIESSVTARLDKMGFLDWPSRFLSNYEMHCTVRATTRTQLEMSVESARSHVEFEGAVLQWYGDGCSACRSHCICLETVLMDNHSGEPARERK
jgi:hypothetical protein